MYNYFFENSVVYKFFFMNFYVKLFEINYGWNVSEWLICGGLKNLKECNLSVIVCYLLVEIMRLKIDY